MAERGTVRLGDEAKDDISGFAGVVVALTQWLNGCERVTIGPRELKDGKPIENYTFDIEQVTVTRPKNHTPVNRTGGDRVSPVRSADPR
jgi:hypothetical protein